MAVSKTFALFLLLALALTGCNAQTVTTISIDYVNCQSLGVVYITSGSFFGQSTVCNTVDQETANYICNNLNYGNVTNYGTAGNLGVSAGSGAIQAMNLKCTSSGGCTFTPANGCTHSQDLVVQCTVQPQVLCGLAAGIIAAIVICVVFFCLILPLICACICCGICYCMGALCFASSTPDYGKL